MIISILKIFLLLYIIYFLYVSIVKIINIKKLKELNTISINELYNKCKTGDLICSRDSSVSMFQELYCKFTHIGIIVEINNEKYILEGNPKGLHISKNYETIGTHLFKLMDRINSYTGSMYFYSLKYNIDKDVLNNFVDNIENFQQIEFEDNYYRLLYSCAMNRVFQKCSINSDKKLCSELVMFCLKQLHVLSDECNCIFPSDFENLKVNDKLLYDSCERIDTKTKPSYSELNNILHYFITFLIVFGGLIGIIFNNLNIVKLHIIFNIIVILHWLTYNNRCIISDLTYGDDESNTKYSEELFSSLFNYKLNDIQSNIIAYLTIIIPTIISIVIVNKSK